MNKIQIFKNTLTLFLFSFSILYRIFLASLPLLILVSLPILFYFFDFDFFYEDKKNTFNYFIAFALIWIFSKVLFYIDIWIFYSWYMDKELLSIFKEHNLDLDKYDLKLSILYNKYLYKLDKVCTDYYSNLTHFLAYTYYTLSFVTFLIIQVIITPS